MKTSSLLVILLGLFCTLCFASELTDDVVMEMIEKMEVASKSKNLQGIADCLSSDVEIASHVSFINLQGGDEINTQSKQEFLEMIKEGWDKFTHYTSSTSNVVINISNNKALVTSDVEESATYQGRTLVENSKQKITVELVEGNPLITKIAMETSVKEVFESQESCKSREIGVKEMFMEIVSDITDAIGLK